MRLHTVTVKVISIDIGEGIGRADLHTCRCSITEVTLGDHTFVRIVVDCTEGTSDGAHFAANTPRLCNHLGPRFGIECNSAYRADHHAPGFITLGTGIGHFHPPLIKGKYLYC